MRMLAAVCFLLLGIYIGVTDWSALSQTPSNASVIAILTVAWLFVSGIHKFCMLAMNEGAASVGAVATGLWLIVMGILLTGHCPTLPPGVLSRVSAISTFIIWMCVDLVGMWQDS